MRYSLFDPLFDRRVFGEPSGGGGGGGGSSSSDDSSSSSGGFLNDLQMGLGIKEKDQDYIDRTAATIQKTQGGSAASTYSNQMENKGFESSYNAPEPEPESKPTLTKGNTIGQVSAAGLYAGDGFEWVETTTSGGSEFLTRTYTGAGKDNGLGQDTIFGSTAQRDMKETIAQISLNEGSAFAGSKASATDIPANDIGIPTGFFPASSSYAEQVGQADYTPKVTYRGEEPAATSKSAATPDPVDTTVDVSLKPKMRPKEEVGPAFDYTGVSMGELGRGAPEGTLSPGTVNYAGGVDPEMEVLSSLKNSSSDPVGDGLMSTGEYLMAQDYENQRTDSPALAGTQFASAGNLSGLATDFNPLTIPLMDETVTKLDPMSAQEASFEQPSTDAGLTEEQLRLGLPTDPVDLSRFEPEKESLKDSIIKVLGGEDVISRALGISDSSLGDLQKNVSTGIVRGGGALTTGLGQTYDQMFRQDDDPLTPYDESGLFKAGQKIFGFGDEMSDAYSKMSDSYEGDQEIYKNLKSYDDAVGYGPGQVDRTLLQAAGKKPGDIVQMGPDMGFDASTAAQKTAQGAGSTAGPLVLSTVPVVGPLLGIGAGQQSVVGELSTELDRFIASDPRIKNTQLYRDALAANQGNEAEAIRAMQQQARGETQKYAAGLGGGATAAQLALFSKANPFLAMAGSGATETLQEGIGESYSTNRILNTLMPELGLPIEKKEVLEASVPAAGAGVTVAAPTAIQQLVSKGPAATTEGPAQSGGDQTPGSDQAFVPTSATAGQTATDPAGIQTEYEKAAGLDTTQMRPEIAPDRVTAAEMIMEQQIEDEGAINVAEGSLQDFNLTEEEINLAAERAITNRMDKDAKMLRALAEDSVVNTGGISSELVEEMNAKLNPDVVARITQEAFSNPLVTKDGETRVDLGLQKAAIEAALQKPPSGIEQAMIPPVDVQTSIPAIDKTTPKDNTAKEDSAVARANEDQAVFDAANEAIAESKREASLDQPETAPTETTLANVVEQALKAADQPQGEASFADAVNLVNETGKFSRSYLQRELGIKYGQASDIVEQMENQGLISKPNYVGKRTVNEDALSEAARELSLTQPAASQQSDVTEFTAIGTEDGVKSRGVFTNALEAKAKALRENVGPEAAEAYEAAVKAQFSPPKPEATEDVSGIKQVADTKDTTPKLSPFTEEGRKGIAALNTSPSKVNLSQTEEEVVVDTKPPSPFTPEGRLEIETQTGPSQVNLSPAENVEGTTNIPAVEQTAVQEEQTKDETKKFLPVIEQTILPGEDDEETVEVEVDDIPETETETGTTVELNLDLPFVAPDIVKDENGNDTFQCPDDSYTLVQGPDGPTCKKNEKASRMRAGRSLSPYTRLNIPEGYKGPGQKRESPRA